MIPAYCVPHWFQRKDQILIFCANVTYHTGYFKTTEPNLGLVCTEFWCIFRVDSEYGRNIQFWRIFLNIEVSSAADWQARQPRGAWREIKTTNHCYAPAFVSSLISCKTLLYITLANWVNIYAAGKRAHFPREDRIFQKYYLFWLLYTWVGKKKWEVRIL